MAEDIDDDNMLTAMARTIHEREVRAGRASEEGWRLSSRNRLRQTISRALRAVYSMPMKDAEYIQEDLRKEGICLSEAEIRDVWKVIVQHIDSERC